MADRYWVGGTASWDGTAGTKWATTSGGGGGASVPTSADDVFFSALSTGTCTIATGNTGAKSINCTGFTGGIAGTAAISVAGSITLFISQTYTHTGVVTLTGTGTLTTAGKTFSPLTINGSGITVTLGDALSLNQGDLIVTQGTFTTSGSNYSITAGRLQSDNSNVRTITLNASTVTLNQGAISPTVGFTTSTNLTFNAGTSTINCNQPQTIFNGGSQTFYNVAIGDNQNNSHTMTGANTFNNLTINNRNSNGTNRLSIAANITVNGTFTSNGTQTLPYRRCWIYSSVGGTNRTITAAAINIFGTDFRDVTGAGAASWTDSSRTNYWGDAGGNSGITFATGRNVYWNLAGTQNWIATAWALTNNGTPATTNYPLIQDTAIFTEAGTAGTVTLDIQNLMLPTVTMADGVSNRTSAMTLNFGTGDRDNFFGNITFFSNLTLSGGGGRIIRLSGYSNTQSITTAGKTLVTNLELAESFNNTVQLQDNLTLPAARTTTLTTGTLDLNNFELSTGLFSSSNSNTRVIAFGTGNIRTTGTGTVWTTATATNLTYTGTPTVNISNNSATATTVTPHTTGGTEANALNFNFTTGTYALTLTTGARVGSLNFTGYTGTWSPSTATCTFYGSLTLVSGMTFTTGTGLWTWANTSGTKTITSASKTLYSITQNGVGGTVALGDATTLSNTYTLTNGTFNLSNQNFTALTFSSSNSNTRTITMGSGTWTLSGTGTVWDTSTATGLTLNQDTSTILLSDTSTTARTFSGGGRTYNNLTIGGATGTSTLTFTGANTFGTIASTKTVAHTITFPNVTTTVSNWTATGTVGNVITLTRTGASGTFTLAKSGGGVISGVDYLSISNSTASPTNTWYAGANSTDGGGNTNWLFTAGPTDILGSASINGTATVTGLGNYTALGLGSISASATVSSSSSLTFSVSGAINGTATVSALGGLSQSGIASINGTASVSALGGLLNSGQASITANGTVTVSGGLLYSGQASVNGTATVTADGFYIADGVAAISAFANVTALGGGVLTGTAGITANGTVIANGVIQGEGWTPITPGTETWTTITAGTETWTDISPSTDIWLRQG